MRSIWVALIIPLLISASLAGLIVVKGNGAVGFDQSSLNVPSVTTSKPVGSLPGRVTMVQPGGGIRLALFHNFNDRHHLLWLWGAMNLTVTVYGARIFIYDFGVQWSTGQSFFRNCSTLMNATETKCLGTLIFGAPSTSGPATLNIGIKLDAYNDRLGAWYDFGPLLQQMPQSVSLHPLASSENFSQSNNPIDEYNKINSLVNFEHVQFIVDEIHQKYPGRLSVFQIAEAYTWVEEHIRYVLENPIDYWPTLSEVLGRGTANCKGQ